MTLSLTMVFYYAECLILFTIMLKVVMLNVIMVNVIMLNVVMLNVFMLSVVVPNTFGASLLTKYKLFRAMQEPT